MQISNPRFNSINDVDGLAIKLLALSGKDTALFDKMLSLAQKDTALLAEINMVKSLLEPLSQGIKLELVPVGIPLPWPMIKAPNGWLECRGQTFDLAMYPKLALAYPSGVLPDLRGEFIRGWDNGRGVDLGRNIGSWQVDELKAHTHKYNGGYKTANAYANSNNTGFLPAEQESVATGGAETRPRNIAFMYIVRAA